MAIGPGEGLEADRGHLRASDADREQVVGTLKAAFVQGRLDRDELDLRVSQAVASRTYRELAAVTADLPVGLTAARPPEPARGSVNKKKPVAALSFATLAVAGILAAPTPSIPDKSPFAPFAVLIIFVFWLLSAAVATGWLWLFHAWLDQRADRQSAQGLPPGPSGPGPRCLPSADPVRQPPPIDPGSQHTEAARRRRPRPALPGSRSLRHWRTRGLLAGQQPAATGAP